MNRAGASGPRLNGRGGLFGVLAPLLVILCAACVGPRDSSQPVFLDLAAGREITLTEAAARFAEADVVHLGESHDDPAHHAAQLAVLRALAGEGTTRPKRLAVGLEMFQHRDQAVLDAWTAGGMDEAAMRAAFARNWSLDWGLYRDIFLFCRERRIPMVGLNVPREITAQVARHGFSSLSPAQLGDLPPVSCIIDPAYEAFLRRVYGAHGTAHSGAGEGFTRFCEAQVLWDAAMSFYAAQYLKERPGTLLAVLAGSVHAWKPAMPARLGAGSGGLRQDVVLPHETGAEQLGPEDADYLVRFSR